MNSRGEIMNEDFKPYIDWLTYRSYETQRFNNPHIPYYKWRKLYPDAITFEEIYEENLPKLLKEKIHGNSRIPQQ